MTSDLLNKADYIAVYGGIDEVLRFGLMEKEWNGKNKDAQIAAIRKIQALPNVVIISQKSEC